MILRGSVEKGDWVLMDLMKRLLREKNRDININMIYFSDVALRESDSRLHPIREPFIVTLWPICCVKPIYY